jgi:potassium-transporting ATPase KdpC subunit
MLAHFRPCFAILAAMTLITGVIYPVLVSSIAQLVFPKQANGSVLLRDDQVVGSELIGQSFSRPEYFWGRLSATGSFPYNAASSGGSNFGPMNPGLYSVVQSRIDALHAADPAAGDPPIDLVTASASGLDPHISIASADYQVARIATARGISEESVRELVRSSTDTRTLGILGEARVNVLVLNLSLDRLKSKSLSEKGSDPLRRDKLTSEIDSPPKGQTPFPIGFK